MNYSDSIDKSARVAHVMGSGDFDLLEMLAAPLELFAHEDFDPDFGVAVDLRKLEFEPSASHLEEIARNLVRFKALLGHRVAVVVSGRIHRFAAELTAAMASAGGVPIRVFSSLEAAQAWVAARP
jgi:hypothetical protein